MLGPGFIYLLGLCLCLARVRGLMNICRVHGWECFWRLPPAEGGCRTGASRGGRACGRARMSQERKTITDTVIPRGGSS